MVEIGFVQTIVVAGLVTFVLFIASMPIGAKAGRSAGRKTLVGSLVALLLVVVASFVVAASNGQLDAFNRELGTDGLLQIGVFMLMVLFTTYFFASRYLDDLERGSRPEREIDA